MKLGIIVGTRPEIIKMAPIIRLCQSRNIPYTLIHTGQHYSYNMDKLFFEQLQLPEPHYNLHSGTENFGLQIGTMLTNIQKILAQEKPDMVIIQGDTNSVLAGTLAASKMGIRVGHVEAGLRSFDISMAEELNRILTDHLSDLLFAPTEIAKQNMIAESINEKKIHITGNTVVDSVQQNIEIAQKTDRLKPFGLTPREYFLITIHRQECVDNEERLTSVIAGLEKLSQYGKSMIFPVHPRTQKMLKAFGLEQRLRNIKNMIVQEPLGYLDILTLEQHARLILTDAGGLQEEACILKVPCVTLRENTERPETIKIGCNILSGYNPENILNGVNHLLQRERDWKNPFGDGKAAERIIDIVQEYVQ